MATKKLMDCCEFISDGDHLPPPKSTDGVPFITISNIMKNNKISFEDTMFVPIEYYNNLGKTKKVKRGDILYTVVGSLGIPVYIDFDKKFAFQRHIAIIRPNGDVNSLYLYYTFLNIQFYNNIKRLAIGCSQKTITLDALRNIEVDVPKKVIQDKIVTILELIDRRIETNNRINDNLEHQLKLLYDYWFTQFEFPDENGKPYRSSGGKMIWNDQLKMNIPLTWKCAKMSKAIETVRTGLNPRNNFKLGTGNIKYVTVKNLKSNGLLDFSGCDTIDEQARQIIHLRSNIQINDILFASIAPLGRCYLIQEQPSDWDINESVFSIRYNRTVLTAEYLYMNLQSELFIKKATACSTGSIFKGIRINALLDSKIIIPPLYITKEFSKKITPLLLFQRKITKENHVLVQLRDWLLPMLMNGQVIIED